MSKDFIIFMVAAVIILAIGFKSGLFNDTIHINSEPAPAIYIEQSINYRTLTNVDLRNIDMIAEMIRKYKSKYDKIPGAINDGRYSMAQLIRDLENNRMLNMYSFQLLSREGYFFQVVGCSTTTDAVRPIHASRFTDGSHLCLIVSDTAPDSKAGHSSKIKEASKLACYIETRFDDLNYATGKGKGIGDNSDFEDCDKAKGVERYSYKIFEL